MLTDRLFKHTMTVGGVSVIIAVSAIFFYLASVVVPLFMPPTVDQRASYAARASRAAHAGLHGRGAARDRRAGRHRRRRDLLPLRHRRVLSETPLPVPAGAQVTAADIGERRTYSQGFGLSNGQVILVKLGFEVTFPDNKRLITPGLSYPLGDQPLATGPPGPADPAARRAAATRLDHRGPDGRQPAAGVGRQHRPPTRSPAHDQRGCRSAKSRRSPPPTCVN
jgi:phosphate transport system permease protein